jgi:energy-coupling factor transporter ATP-binding protein EcfA2
MFQKLQLYNILKHEQLDIDLGKITVFVGKNDQGKSSILKGLGWLCGQFNANVQKLDTDQSFVQVVVDDTPIAKVKTSTGISYRIPTKTFTRVGTTVPQEVQTILNVGNINFQFQFDAPIINSQQLFSFLEDDIEIAEKIKQKLKEKRDQVSGQLESVTSDLDNLKANSLLLQQAQDLIPKGLLLLRRYIMYQIILLKQYLIRLQSLYIKKLILTRELIQNYITKLSDMVVLHKKIQVVRLLQQYSIVEEYQQRIRQSISLYVQLLLKKREVIIEYQYLLNQAISLVQVRLILLGIKVDQYRCLLIQRLILGKRKITLLQSWYKQLYSMLLYHKIYFQNVCPCCGQSISMGGRSAY